MDTLVFQFRGDTWKHLSLSDTAAKSTIESNQQAIKEKIKDHLRNYEKTVTSAQEQALFERAGPLCERYMHLIETEVLPLSRGQKLGEARAAYLQYADPVHAELKSVLRGLVDLKKKRGDEYSAAAAAAAAQGRIGTLAVTLLAFIAGGALVVFSVRSINAALEQAVTELSATAGQVTQARRRYRALVNPWLRGLPSRLLRYKKPRPLPRRSAR